MSIVVEVQNRSRNVDSIPRILTEFKWKYSNVKNDALLSLVYSPYHAISMFDFIGNTQNM